MFTAENRDTGPLALQPNITEAFPTHPVASAPSLASKHSPQNAPLTFGDTSLSVIHEEIEPVVHSIKRK
jgi:hypothetical protein